MKIVFIGAGNLATNLATELFFCGFQIVQVYSRSQKSAKELAKKVNSEFTCDLSEISAKANLYIISVKDDAISEIIEKVDFGNKLVVHTAGSISISVFQAKAANFGVFYPLQTFSKEKIIKFSEIPICLEANSLENLELLHSVASKISTDVRIISSEQRKTIHLAAVFACNFSNHLFAIAEKILNDNEISFDILKPLLLETIDKALINKPQIVQTGPAIRGDHEVMTHQLAMLKENNNFAEIYRLLSKSIQDF